MKSFSPLQRQVTTRRRHEFHWRATQRGFDPLVTSAYSAQFLSLSLRRAYGKDEVEVVLDPYVALPRTKSRLSPRARAKLVAS